MPGVFDLDPKDFVVVNLKEDNTAAKDLQAPTRDQVPRIQFLLKRSVDEDSGVVSYGRFPPILYRDPNNLSKSEDRFRNPGLFKVRAYYNLIFHNLQRPTHHFS